MDLRKNSVITDIKLDYNIIQIYFDSLFADYAWLEDDNKHNCNIVSCKINITERKIEININTIINFLRQNRILKLSLSNEYKRYDYDIVDESLLKRINNTIAISFLEFGVNKKGDLIILPKDINLIDSEIFSVNPLIELKNDENNLMKSSLLECPKKVMVFGSCFSRSMFKSDEYFNPEYKKYFKVCYTSFHNSIISIMSKAILDYNYSKFNDLYYEGIKDYIDMEFAKNLFDVIDKLNPDYIVIDNYADATLPIVKIKNGSYITYNKYFSESVFKRNFSECKVILPGTQKHAQLYSKYINLFSKEICKRNLENNIILIGGRLSLTKKDANSISEWSQRNWIIPSNNYWDIIDQLFLNKLPKTTYIDFRNTKWVSDVDSPLIGGATPSHYQSGYYKDMFNQLKKVVFTQGEYKKNDRL